MPVYILPVKVSKSPDSVPSWLSSSKDRFLNKFSQDAFQQGESSEEIMEVRLRTRSDLSVMSTAVLETYPDSSSDRKQDAIKKIIPVQTTPIVSLTATELLSVHDEPTRER